MSPLRSRTDLGQGKDVPDISPAAGDEGPHGRVFNIDGDSVGQQLISRWHSDLRECKEGG